MFISPERTLVKKVKSDKKGIVSVFFFEEHHFKSLTVREGKMMTNNGR